MNKQRCIELFEKEISPLLTAYEVNQRAFDDGDFGPLYQVEFNSKEIGGNIDFWGLD